MSEFDTSMVDAMMAADEKRNTRVQKYCGFCGCEFLGDQDIDEKFCPDCRED